MMRSFIFPIQLRANLFALLNLSSRLLSLSIGVDIRFAHCRRLVPPVWWLLVICVCLPSISYASSPPSNDVHICEVLDYEDIRARDSLYVATKQALNLNVGEPRTVRMIYFLPNDRPFQQEVVDSMKVTIRQIQTFYADQMEAHGYGRKTFRFETDAQDDPVVHRVDGQHPNSYYLENSGYWLEIREKFDTRANNVYLTVWDNGTRVVRPGAAGSGAGGRDGGGAVVSARFHWTTIAHELGHTFGLWHDFRDGNYIMSYGPRRENQLSACHAEFLTVHPYFNTGSEDKETPEPTIELISPTGYPPGSTSVPVRLKVNDPDGLHQVILFVNSRRGFAGGSREVKACRGLSGEKHTVVQFDYNGAVPSDSTYKRGIGTLSDPLLHSINVRAVDSFGNVGSTYFTLFDISTQRNVIATLKGHTSSVNSVVFSPDGKVLASASDDLTVKLWDVSRRTTIATLSGHVYRPRRRDGVNSVVFSSDGKMLASAGGDLTVKLWDVSRRTNIATLEGHMSINRRRDGVNSVVFSPDGKILASAGADLTVKLWDVSKRTNIATLEGHGSNSNGGVNSVAFSPDGKILASGAWDQTVKLWDVATRQNIATMRQGTNAFVHSVAFSPDGSTLASGTGNGIRLWDVATRINIAPYMATEHSYSVAFSPDGSILASGLHHKAIEIVHVATKRILATFTGHTKEVLGLSFSPDGSTLASASGDGTIKLWNMSELPSYPQTIVKISGDKQEGAPNALLADPLVVEVRDQNDNVLEGFPVTFTTTSGDGRLSGKFTVENTTTDVNGRAQSTLTLGPNPGTNTVEVSVTGLKPVIFNAVGVGTPAIPIMGGDYQTWNLPRDAIIRLGKGAIGESDRSVAFSPDDQCLAVASGIGAWLYEVATSQPLALLPSESWVHSVVFSPDGTMLASGLSNGRIELWEVETGTKVTTFEGYRGRVYSVVFSPDGTTLVASGVGDRIIRLWDIATQTTIAELEGHRGINSVAISSDGTTLVSGSNDRTIKLWDIATRRNIATLRQANWVTSVVFSPDGAILASGVHRTVKLWDVATRHNIATLEGHWGRVNAVVFSPDGTLLASGASSTVKLWDVATRRNIATLEGHTDNVESVSFSFDGTTLVSGSTDGTVRLWGIKTRNTAILSGHIPFSSMAFSSDGTTFAAGSGRKVVLWDIATKRNIATLEEHSGSVHSVSFSPSGTLLASGSEREVVLWDVATRRNIATLEGHTGIVNSVVFSPNGAILASRDSSTVKLWDVATRRNIATLEGHTDNVESVSFSFDGTTLVSGSTDGTVRLWDIATQTTIAELEGHRGSIYSAAISSDGTTLASGSRDRTIKLWDVATKRNIATLEGHRGRVTSVVFSPDGAILASRASSTVKLWDVATRRNIATFWNVNSVVFSPEGTLLASGVHRTVKLWDIATRRDIATLEGHRGRVNSVVFSPDGAILASGSSDDTILLWNMSQYVTPTSAPTPDFDGDGTVGISDFLQFVDQFGFSQGDVGYDARFDLDGDGVIGIGDFLIFVDSFGKKVSS